MQKKENIEEGFEFVYTQKDYRQWLKELAEIMHQQVENDIVVFTEAVGSGYSRSLKLDEGLSCGIQNYQLKNDYTFKRLPTETFGVIIYMYHFQVEESIKYELNKLEVNIDAGDYHTLRVTNSQTQHQLHFGKTTAVKGLSIFLENEWITKNISRAITPVFNYLKEVDFFKEFINAKQQKLMNEIIDLPTDHPYPELFIKSRVMRLLDKIFESFLERDITELPEKLSENDFMMVQKVEFILINNYTEVFPSIEKLARLALMSESKLKKLFKQSFGMGMYEYYQKNRMHRAKDLILTRKHSVTEVGTMLGYQNLSNFSNAFKKEFNFLPSEVLSLM
ncbi:MAG: helix-turn-helix transcriptional regulator [Ferruginibacter sp.]